EDQRRDYEKRARISGFSLKAIGFKASFRSAPTILDGVDLVFGQEYMRKGVTSDGAGTAHQSLRPNALGRIDVWDLVRAVKAAAPDDWTSRQSLEQSPLVQVAKTLAKTIARWVETGFAKPGEILVLVRKRNAFIHALARELKTLDVPVGGVDRLTLLSHIAIKDLLALARICVAPADSLSLASLLKSPVFSYTENNLMALGLAARGNTLFDALRHQSDTRSKTVLDQILVWRDRADTMPIDAFFATALGADGLRRKFVARFGAEVEDILDEFLALANEASRQDNPGLDAFIEALEAAPPVIKREMDQSRNEVRILTVHGAKGLEAPHIMLVDGGGAISSINQRPVLGLFANAEAPLYGRDCYLWTAANNGAPLYQAIMERDASLAEDEYRRLLYVAMTRAENTLTICGWRGVKDTKPGWAEWVKAGLFGLDGKSNHVSPEGVAICRFEPNGMLPEAGVVEINTTGNTSAYVFPSLPPEPEIPRPLAPSAAALIIEADGEAELETLLAPQPFVSPVLGNGTQTPFAMQRGTLIHALLQRLPDMPIGGRAKAASRFVERNAPLLNDIEQAGIVDEALHLVNDPAFSILFAPGSKAEVQVSGTVNLRGKTQMIAGKIDRISQVENTVTLIDFKTGRAPNLVSEISPGHVVQLALYRQLVLPVFPGLQVKAALVYTSAPKIFYLENSQMNNALDGLGVEFA
ncbi:MAG: 3'-5' exonuclease, partial [Notoacmeibacter sp.]